MTAAAVTGFCAATKEQSSHGAGPPPQQQRFAALQELMHRLRRGRPTLAAGLGATASTRSGAVRLGPLLLVLVSSRFFVSVTSATLGFCDMGIDTSSA
jgi:hypothetical protein